MMGKPRARNLKGSYGVLTDEKYYEMTATTNAGEKLILKSTHNLQGSRYGSTNFPGRCEEAAMQELKNEGNQVYLSELSLLATGIWSKSIGLTLKLTAENGLPLAGTTALCSTDPEPTLPNC